MTPSRHIPAIAFAGTALLFSSWALPAEDPCFIAYWDSTKIKEFATCEMAAKTGDAKSEFGYGLILFSGQNRQNNRTEGLEWFRKSARQGHQLARISLGTFLSRSDLGEHLGNLPEAYAWFSVAGAVEAAAKVKGRMTTGEFDEAARLAAEYQAKYGPSRGRSGS